MVICSYFAERTLPKKTSCTSCALISGTRAMAAAGLSVGSQQDRWRVYTHLIAWEPN